MQLQYDRRDNTLRLTLSEPATRSADQVDLNGTVDVAAGGRLVGIELRPDDGPELMERWLRPWLDDEIAGEFVSIEADGSAYIELTVGDPSDEVRSSDVAVRTELDDGGELVAIAIPRRGAGYEISYPSGNR